MKTTILLICLLLLSGCAGKLSAPTDDAVLDPVQDGNQSDEICGLESCHGYEDLACGSNAPDFCTMEYQLGDFCRQYAICEVISGECQMVPNEKLAECQNCVRQCENEFDGPEVFDCENTCREELE